MKNLLIIFILFSIIKNSRAQDSITDIRNYFNEVEALSQHTCNCLKEARELTANNPEKILEKCKTQSLQKLSIDQRYLSKEGYPLLVFTSLIKNCPAFYKIYLAMDTKEIVNLSEEICNCLGPKKSAANIMGLAGDCLLKNISKKLPYYKDRDLVNLVGFSLASQICPYKLTFEILTDQSIKPPNPVDVELPTSSITNTESGSVMEDSLIRLNTICGCIDKYRQTQHRSINLLKECVKKTYEKIPSYLNDEAKIKEVLAKHCPIPLEKYTSFYNKSFYIDYAIIGVIFLILIYLIKSFLKTLKK